MQRVLPVVPVWRPILLGGIWKETGGRSGPRPIKEMPACGKSRRRAERYGLLPLKWPEGWPNNTLHAMRAAVFAQQGGRAVAFSLAAFRQAFAGGKDLSDVDNVLIAAAACELHPRAVLKGIELQSTKDRLREATADAYARGVRRRADRCDRRPAVLRRRSPAGRQPRRWPEGRAGKRPWVCAPGACKGRTEGRGDRPLNPGAGARARPRTARPPNRGWCELKPIPTGYSPTNGNEGHERRHERRGQRRQGRPPRPLRYRAPRRSASGRSSTTCPIRTPAAPCSAR